VPKATALRRLTSAQYRNAVADLLGPSITPPDDLEADTEVDGFVSLGATRTVPSARGTDQYATAAYAEAHQALVLSESREAFVGCAPAAFGDGDCARAFIAQFGRRAFRRPLQGDEIDRYLDLFQQAVAVVDDFHAGLEYVVSAMLQSPYFLYRAEIGEPDALDPTRRVLDGHELGSRLSFFLWNTTPDDAMLDAAASGELGTDAGLARQVSRLLDSPRAMKAEDQFFSELFELGRLDDLPQLPAFYPQMTPTFGSAARQEILLLIEDIVSSRNADYRELFETTRAFLNPEMADLYGAPAHLEPSVTTLAPERAGMLARAAFLALNAHATSTSPTRRGKFVREILLCQTIAPPPPNVNVALRTDAASPVPRTLREQLALHSINPVCAGCHVPLDPIGLGLEAFDGVGAFRSTEIGRDVDDRGTFDGVPFTGAAELGSLVKEHEDLGPCLVRKLLAYATGHLESDGEQPVVSALSKNFAAHGWRFRSLAEATVQSASFRYTGQPE
jgi:hypothetical protein